ncbi:putative gustatory receptor 28b [Diachasma alloeum]|uniref:Gustatory receptor n=1 Tax=Diachasma alloeum TaxID=454923 RepID=A0A4E0RYV1_9HYME|nr:putative gustatory receptor 28b [Diachasma alloeum]THK32951.1 gustatory receptor 6 [Diachasma alloeum]
MGASIQKVEKKWELFRASNYLSLMGPCFELLRIHGLFPYKYNNKGVIVSSKYGWIYATLISVLCIIVNAVVLYMMDISKSLAFDSVPGTLQGNCYMLLAEWIAIVSYILSSKRMRLLRDIASVSASLSALSFRQLSKIIHAKDIMGFLFLMAQATNLYSSKLDLTLSKVINMYATLVVFLMDMLYADCVLVIGECFKNINEKLLTLKTNMEKDEPHLLRRVYHEKRNPMILMEIRGIKSQHNDVSELVHSLNQTFSLQLVATVTLTFAEVTFSLYFYILQRLGKSGINLEKQIWYSYFSTSVTYYTLKLAAIVWACEISKDQAVKTGIIVHEVLIDTVDKQVKEELFSLQVLHRDNTFTARGLSLDATLLTSIVGGITTYLLILIQFMVSSKSCGSVMDPTSPPRT